MTLVSDSGSFKISGKFHTSVGQFIRNRNKPPVGIRGILNFRTGGSLRVRIPGSDIYIYSPGYFVQKNQGLDSGFMTTVLKCSETVK
jgi:hypothetical protein